MNLVDKIKVILEPYKTAKTFWVAYSGGVDSHVLLDVVSQLRPHFPFVTVKAIHIHHGLYEGATHWEKHAKTICQGYEILCKAMRVKVVCAPSESLEACARTARYQAFAKEMNENDILLTAHHADDQAETCLLQFLRGSGPAGLASMPVEMPFSKGLLVRPFLSISRADILTYAEHRKLSWIEDTSNHDTHFARNFLRYEIMPIFKKRWPSVNKTIMRVAENCAETLTLFDEMGQCDCALAKGRVQNTLSVKMLLSFSLARRKNALRYFIHAARVSLPSAAQLDQIVSRVLMAKPDASPCVAFSDRELRRYQDDLYLLEPLLPIDSNWEATIKSNVDILLPANLGVLTVTKQKGKGLRMLKKPYTVHFRQEKEHMRIVGRKGTHTLKKLFQEWQVPPWQRNRIPLIFYEDQLVMVVGYATGEDFFAKSSEEGLEIVIRS